LIKIEPLDYKSGLFPNGRETTFKWTGVHFGSHKWIIDFQEYLLGFGETRILGVDLDLGQPLLRHEYVL
jgi:hypothetical protein